jgi:hypothetical protein
MSAAKERKVDAPLVAGAWAQQHGRSTHLRSPSAGGVCAHPPVPWSPCPRATPEAPSGPVGSAAGEHAKDRQCPGDNVDAVEHPPVAHPQASPFVPDERRGRWAFGVHGQSLDRSDHPTADRRVEPSEVALGRPREEELKWLAQSPRSRRASASGLTWPAAIAASASSRAAMSSLLRCPSSGSARSEISARASAAASSGSSSTSL